MYPGVPTTRRGAVAVVARPPGITGQPLGLELEGGIEQRTAFAGKLFLICLLLLMGPWVLTPLMRLWTALVPSRGVAWYLAVQSCRARAARSVTTVLPFALSLSFIALFMTMGNVMPGSTAGLGDVMTVLDWVFVVSWSGGLAVIALVGRERTRDSAVVAVVGARPGVTTRSTEVVSPDRRPAGAADPAFLTAAEDGAQAMVTLA
ncbi:hypothetical protein [Streptomyces anulatus]|uniref:hypothetical protein n=1 Tax=Streptomyces anulatus TaxID=1892 RepID=UPI0036417167